MTSCAELIAARDWSASPLGPRARWPAALRAMVDTMLHARQPMLLFWGPDWIQFYNDAFVPSFGQGKHPAAMGQSARVCWADAWPVVGAQLEAVAGRGEPAWHEDTLVPIFRNGRMEEVFWTYSYSPAYDEAGAIRGVLVICTETTGRVLAVRRLAALARLALDLSRATQHFAVLDAVSAVARSCPQDLPVLVACDDRGHRRATSDAAVELAGTDGPIRALRTPVATDVWPEPVRDAFVARAWSLSLVVGLSPRLPYDTAYLEFLGQIAEQAGVALRRIDDTEIEARSASERAAMLSALQEANRAKDEFLAMLGHELRNPLAPIVSALELMKTRDGSPSSERDAIERQVRHVVRLVDDLLDVSRIARGKLELQRAPVDIAEIVATAADVTASLIQQRGHQLTVDVAPRLIVDGDVTRLTQVVSNLLVNAARYTPPGGTISVTAAREGENAVIRVRDNGKGIAPELAPRIFDLFVQGKRSPDRVEGGLGIGLAIVKNLVAAHGGSVAVQSDGEGTGATFTVVLPVGARAAQAAAAPTPSPRGRPVAGRRILIVDDNEDAATLLGDVLRIHGHEVALAHHPDTALETLNTFDAEIAVLDIGLPAMDGYELGERIRERRPHCRIVALTGYGQRGDHERSSRAGFIAHLVKPVRIDMFLELLG